MPNRCNLRLSVLYRERRIIEYAEVSVRMWDHQVVTCDCLSSVEDGVEAAGVSIGGLG